MTVDWIESLADALATLWGSVLDPELISLLFEWVLILEEGSRVVQGGCLESWVILILLRAEEPVCWMQRPRSLCRGFDRILRGLTFW